MGRLAGFGYREVACKLRALDFVFDRQGPGSHEVWRHQVTGRAERLALHASSHSIHHPAIAALEITP